LGDGSCLILRISLPIVSHQDSRWSAHIRSNPSGDETKEAAWICSKPPPPGRQAVVVGRSWRGRDRKHGLGAQLYERGLCLHVGDEILAGLSFSARGHRPRLS
jgi:hypothetical protein